MRRVFIVSAFVLVSLFWALSPLNPTRKKAADGDAPPFHSAQRSDSDRGAHTRASDQERQGRAPASPSQSLLNHWDQADYDAAERAMSDWLAIDAHAAISFVSLLKAPYEVPHFAHVMSQHLQTLAVAEAWELSRLLDAHTETRLAVIGDLFGDFYQKDPETAMKWLAEADSNTDEFSYFLAHRTAITGRLGEPYAALQALHAMPEGNVQLALITGLFERWLVDDIEAATAVLNRVEDSHLYDRATMNYVESAVYISGEAAMSWATAIVQKDLRDVAVANVVTAWNEQAPDEYRDWLARESEAR